MSTDGQVAPSKHALERPLYVLLIGASALNLGANLFADMTVPEGKNPTTWVLWLLWTSKPMIVPVLTGILFLRTRGTVSSICRGPFYLGLLFCWFGDIALLSASALFFQIGLGAFGVAHLFFIRAYLKGSDWRSVVDRKTLIYGLPFLVYGYTQYSVIHYQEKMQAAPMMSLAIGVYMVVLLSHGMSGFIRMRLEDAKSSASILVGIVLFVQSDSIIAVNDFVLHLPLDRFAIMATYILGISLMVRGCILNCEEHTRQQPSEPSARLSSTA
ncbi:lysoplasmalogenase [Stigmatella erecta]|uniref:YhhN-like protein n=1 Tax=Stigmatella erecta TaxID=83460 RepID=A0A1H9YQ12_9BACT|nr:lysoplasmalogenase [Stigmatella erecta]SES71174.1 YhhN-like protein [Stigmatella erecta]